MMHNFVFFCIFCCFFQNTLIAQNKDDSNFMLERKYHPTNRAAETGWFFSLIGRPYFSSSNFEMSDDLIDGYNMHGIFVKSNSSYSFRGEINYFFTKNLGLGLGGGFSNYSLSLNILEINYIESEIIGHQEIVYYDYVFKGESILESIDFSSMNLYLNICYKQAILKHLFIYGNLNGGVISFTKNNNFFRNASNLYSRGVATVTTVDGHQYTYELHALVPTDSTIAEFLYRNQLFDERINPINVADINDLLPLVLVGSANLGVMVSLNKRLKIKFGGVFRFSETNILNGDGLPDTSVPLVTVVREGGSFKNIYTPLLIRQGNQMKLSSLGLEIGIVCKL